MHETIYKYEIFILALDFKTLKWAGYMALNMY